MSSTHRNLVPDFLVIGAMKCATTTMHQDLVKHPEIFCGTKELNALTDEPNRKQSGEELYRHNYRDAEAHQLLGDISTHYSMLPHHDGVAEIAAKTIGPDLKIIYLVREPIARSLSHHQHMMNESSDEKMSPDVNFEIRNNPAPIAYSQYAMQLDPWIAVFGIDQIKVVKFEEYVSNRAATIAGVFEFLELKPYSIEIDGAGANRGHDRRVAGKFMRRIWQTKTFQRILKPLSPNFVRSIGRKILLKKASQAVVAPTVSTIDFIYENVKEDADRLKRLTGRSEPFWDLKLARSKHVDKLSQNSGTELKS
jgi:hypothetical protein